MYLQKSSKTNKTSVKLKQYSYSLQYRRYYILIPTSYNVTKPKKCQSKLQVRLTTKKRHTVTALQNSMKIWMSLISYRYVVSPLEVSESTCYTYDGLYSRNRLQCSMPAVPRQRAVFLRTSWRRTCTLMTSRGACLFTSDAVARQRVACFPLLTRQDRDALSPAQLQKEQNKRGCMMKNRALLTSFYLPCDSSITSKVVRATVNGHTTVLNQPLSYDRTVFTFHLRQ